MDDAETSVAELPPSSPFQLGILTVDPMAGELSGPGGREQLDPKVMAVLLVLAQRAGSVVLREELFQRVWPGTIVSDDALSRCVYQLRRHFCRAGGRDECKTLVETLPKRGYRLNRDAPLAISQSAAATHPMRFAAVSSVNAKTRTVALAATTTTLAIMAAASGWLLVRDEHTESNPLANARFTYLADFAGIEQDAAISRDGKLVAFLSDRDGQFDVWISQIGTGEFHNLTQGRGGELRNPAVRTVGFSPDGTLVSFWSRTTDPTGTTARIEARAVPSLGGGLRAYVPGAAELAWSPDATRVVYHTTDSGDPLFVTEPGRDATEPIFVGPPGGHCHFPLWSPDGAFIYFVYGSPPERVDIWRIAVSGGEPERITFHDSRVAYPVFLDERTLLYLATAQDGSGQQIHGLDIDRRESRRLSFGVEQYTSLAASGDGRRLVATVTRPRTSLWRVPILPRVANDADAVEIALPTRGGSSPRVGPGSLLYLSPNDRADGIWKLAEGAATEIWPGRQGRVVAGPTLAPDGGRIAFPATLGNAMRLHVMNLDGTAPHVLADELDVRGAAAWSPDGRSIAVAAERGDGPRLFRVPLDGGHPMQITDEHALDPVWAPSGEFLLYRGAEIGPAFPLRATTVDGRAHEAPNIVLPRSSRFAFLPGESVLVVLKGEIQHKNFWLLDLATGDERQLTDFGVELSIGDFGVSPDGVEIVFDRIREEADVIMIDLAPS